MPDRESGSPNGEPEQVGSFAQKFEQARRAYLEARTRTPEDRPKIDAAFKAWLAVSSALQEGRRRLRYRSPSPRGRAH